MFTLDTREGFVASGFMAMLNFRNVAVATTAFIAHHTHFDIGNRLIAGIAYD
jgi:hypothetical protein